LARGPDRQALHARSRARMRVPTRLPGVRVRQDAGAPQHLPEGDPPQCSRDRGQSQVRVRATTSRSQGLTMAAWATAARDEETVAAPRTRPRAVKRERRVTGGVFWIGVVAALLAGVVATNVAVLRLNMKLDSLGRERADLRAQNAQLSSQLSS